MNGRDSTVRQCRLSLLTQIVGTAVRTIAQDKTACVNPFLPSIQPFAERKATLSLPLVIALILQLATPAWADDDGPLTLVDLPRLRSAIESKITANPAQNVTFRELWDQPNSFRDKPVLVEGRVVAIFHKPAVGQFPALAEAWLFNSASDPFCLVFPETARATAPKLGETVTFPGVFLRRVRYHSGDVDRLAPLLAGPSPPQRLTPATSEPVAPSSGWDNVVLIVVGLAVLSVLLRIAARRPKTRPIVADPTPIFEDAPESTMPESRG